MPEPFDANTPDLFQRLVDVVKEHGKLDMLVVSPHPGKYYIVDSVLVFVSSSKKDPEEKLLVILDCHSLNQIDIADEIVEAHQMARVTSDARRENKN